MFRDCFVGMNNEKIQKNIFIIMKLLLSAHLGRREVVRRKRGVTEAGAVAREVREPVSFLIFTISF